MALDPRSRALPPVSIVFAALFGDNLLPFFVSGNGEPIIPMFSPDIIAPKAAHRSAVTNGSALLPGVDGRTAWARRLRDVMLLHLDDLGGPSAVSEAEKSVVRRAATLTVELERMEAVFAMAGEAATADLDAYQRASNSLRRMLESVGLKRRPRDVTPRLTDYIEGRAL